MSPVFALSLRSIANRRLSVALTVVAVALAVAEAAQSGQRTAVDYGDQ